MKKILFVLLAFVMLSVSTAIGEGFTLHNGTTFGMTKEQVMDTEKLAGVDLVDNSWSNSWEGTIAGQTGTLYYYYDDDGKLNSMNYSFNSPDGYDLMNEGLCEKYGNPKYTEETGGEFGQWFGSDFFPLSSVEVNITEDLFTRVRQISNAKYSQWLLTNNDGSAVFICHYTYRDETLLWRIDPPFGDDGPLIRHYIEYKYLTPSETERVLGPKISDDL